MEIKYINHDYNDSYEQTDWREMKVEIRDYLRTLVRNIIEGFENNHKSKVRSNGDIVQDPTMFAGSGGVAYCLFKYWKLVRYEVKMYSNADDCELLHMAEDYLLYTIERNLQILK